MRSFRFALISVLVFSSTGCSMIRSVTMPDEENLMAGAGALVVGESGRVQAYEQIDITQLLKTYGLENPREFSSEANADGYKYLRNDLQDRLIAASNQRCASYMRMLVASKSQTQMGWSGLATLLSGAAAVTTPASAAKVLAASSTVSSGILSNYNEAYFSNLTAQVISAGISKQREAALVNIQSRRHSSLVEYPVNRAIADALSYHGMCNMVTGLETASAATKNAIATDVAKSSAVE